MHSATFWTNVMNDCDTVVTFANYINVTNIARLVSHFQFKMMLTIP